MDGKINYPMITTKRNNNYNTVQQSKLIQTISQKNLKQKVKIIFVMVSRNKV